MNKLRLSDLLFLEERVCKEYQLEKVEAVINGQTVTAYRHPNGMLGVKTYKFFYNKTTGEPEGVVVWIEFEDGSSIDILECFEDDNFIETC